MSRCLGCQARNHITSSRLSNHSVSRCRHHHQVVQLQCLPMSSIYVFTIPKLSNQNHPQVVQLECLPYVVTIPMLSNRVSPYVVTIPKLSNQSVSLCHHHQQVVQLECLLRRHHSHVVQQSVSLCCHYPKLSIDPIRIPPSPSCPIRVSPYVFTIPKLSDQSVSLCRHHPQVVQLECIPMLSPSPCCPVRESLYVQAVQLEGLLPL